MSRLPFRRPGVSTKDLLTGWRKILAGRAPMLSIEITRECPLSCPGCYAYGETHLGGGITLRQLSDFRGDALVQGVLDLVRAHRPIHVSLVGGEPMIRHRELNRLLPAIEQLGVYTLLVTSGVIRIPREWMAIPRLRVAVSVDGLPEHHDVRRKPATYDRILANIRDCTVNIHWVITRPMLERAGYFEEYVAFWSGHHEVNRIMASTYSPQIGEQSPEMLSVEDRRIVASQLLQLKDQYPKLLINARMAAAFLKPPSNPRECLFSKMSLNYSADLKSRVEPCVFGGDPDCSQCGCAASIGLHSVKSVRVVAWLKLDHLIRLSEVVGACMTRFRRGEDTPQRWHAGSGQPTSDPVLVQIGSSRS